MTLAVEGLCAGYGETEVLDDVSLEVPAGEVVALVGRNGAGKTTTLRAIMGSVPAREGTVRFRGEPITDLDPEPTVRRGIGIVPEERRVFPGLTVAENLKLGTIGGGDADHGRSVGEVLDAFDELADRRDAQGQHLSGGEQQMLAVGRTLVAGADLLLLDEPTEGLAPMIVDRVTDLVRELNADGITVLLVEQNLAVAMELADRIYVIDQGEIVFEGTPDELEANPDVRDRHLGVSL
ncbi:ABC transporter ATP-binding protein [Halobacteriales archaeon QH_10_70_21]|nr:MAG: ABC transporter ATP-binding protein [Halobacteriales archaeon QH_10_70_21]